jgi:hypothetical protein
MTEGYLKDERCEASSIQLTEAERAFITNQGVAPLRHSQVASNWSKCVMLLNHCGESLSCLCPLS